MYFNWLEFEINNPASMAKIDIVKCHESLGTMKSKIAFIIRGFEADRWKTDQPAKVVMSYRAPFFKQSRTRSTSPVRIAAWMAERPVESNMFRSTSSKIELFRFKLWPKRRKMFFHWPFPIASSNFVFSASAVLLTFSTERLGETMIRRRRTEGWNSIDFESSSSIFDLWRFRRFTVLQVRFDWRVASGASVDSFKGEAGGDGGS